jgi:hypothetical protein
MIRWIWNRMMKWGWDYSYQPVEDDGSIRLPRLRGRSRLGDSPVVCDSDSDIDLYDPITFKVQAVSGGTVVESRWYDHKKDYSHTKLHIVTSEENLAEAIGKIVTMELLQK